MSYACEIYRYFSTSSPDKRFCPYGKDCFYQHLNDDGTPYVFQEGVDLMMERHKAKLIASRALSTAALMEAFMADSGFGHNWIPSGLTGGLYESDDDDDYGGSDLSDLDWMPSLIF
jgi:uncharacterized protein YfeS